MSVYQAIAKYGPRFFKRSSLFKHGLNWSPMYRRTTGRVVSVSDDLLRIVVEVPIGYRNRNYVGAIFGGSLFSAVDPVPMVQLINLLDSDYIVWDKSAEIRFKVPAYQDVVAESIYTPDEVEAIRTEVEAAGEMVYAKTTRYTDRRGETVFCEVDKTLYIATKAHHKAKKRRRESAPD
ncbi:MAG: DUF4442 domain-containing protein [Pseudomonadota bacterium]